MVHKIMAFFLILPSLFILPSLAVSEDVGGYTEAARLSVTAVVAPFTSVKMSVDEISFNIEGEPGLFEADQPVKVTVGSNQAKWGVYLQSSELVSEKGHADPLPPSRLAFSINHQKEFQSLEKKRLLVQGAAGSQPTDFNLHFRLTTRWEDLPGTYRGEITFSFLSSP